MGRERLTGKHLRQVLEFVYDLYAPRHSDTITTHLVSALPRLVPAEVHSYNEVNAAQHLVAYKLNPADFRQVANATDILSQYLDQHAFVQHAAATGDCGPHTFGDFMSLREFKRTDLYQEFYGPMRIPYSLFMNVRDPDEAGTTVTLGMHRGSRDFAERDQSVLILLRPHIRQALANAHLITRLEAHNSALQSAMAESSMSVLTLTSKNTVLSGMPRAITFLTQIQGWNPRHPDHLPPILLEWVQRLGHGFTCTPEVPIPPSPLELDCGPHHLRLRFLLGGTQRIIVLEETASTLTPDQLACLGLTKREMEVLSWVAEGKTNVETAMILGMKSATVKKHLEHIYDKLGVETRMAATARARDLVDNWKRSSHHSVTDL